MAPVAKGYISYDKLIDGTLTLWDFGLMNDTIAIEGENQRRAQERAEQEAKRHG